MWESMRILFYSRGMEIMLSTGILLLEALAEEMLPELLRKRIPPIRKAVDVSKVNVVSIFQGLNFFTNICQNDRTR